jgi:hypothetical protein
MSGVYHEFGDEAVENGVFVVTLFTQQQEVVGSARHLNTAGSEHMPRTKSESGGTHTKSACTSRLIAPRVVVRRTNALVPVPLRLRLPRICWYRISRSLSSDKSATSFLVVTDTAVEVKEATHICIKGVVGGESRAKY